MEGPLSKWPISSCIARVPLYSQGLLSAGEPLGGGWLGWRRWPGYSVTSSVRQMVYDYGSADTSHRYFEGRTTKIMLGICHMIMLWRSFCDTLGRLCKILRLSVFCDTVCHGISWVPNCFVFVVVFAWIKAARQLITKLRRYSILHFFRFVLQVVAAQVTGAKQVFSFTHSYGGQCFTGTSYLSFDLIIA